MRTSTLSTIEREPQPLAADAADVCHRCDLAPATRDGILCDGCRAVVRAQEASPIPILRRTCPVCGDEFDPVTRVHLYCSDRCEDRGRHRRRHGQPIDDATFAWEHGGTHGGTYGPRGRR